MRKILFLLLFVPFLAAAQFDKTIKLKVAMMQNFVQKDSLGEVTFWQTKGKITYNIVNYTNQQNSIFKDLFIKQYQELLPIYKKMIVSEDTRDTDLFIKTLIRQEDDYRSLLTTEQLKAYSNKLSDFEKNDLKNHESYSSLFFSDNLLAEYKYKFEFDKQSLNSKLKPSTPRTKTRKPKLKTL